MIVESTVKNDRAMDGLTFVASIVGSVAWPIAAFAIALLFRKQIRRLLERIKRLSVGGNSVDFDERLDQAETVADAVSSSSHVALNNNADDVLPDDRTSQLISLSPSAAVLDAWRSVERLVKDKSQILTSEYSTRTKRIVSFRLAAKALLDAGHISAATYSLLYDLQQIRNAAAHTDTVTALDAMRFMTLVKKAMFFLDGPDVRPDNPDP